MIAFNKSVPPAQDRYELSSKVLFPLELDSEGKRVYDSAKAAEIESELARFSGTKKYHRYGDFLFTDGMAAMAERCDAVLLLVIAPRLALVLHDHLLPPLKYGDSYDDHPDGE